MALIIVMIVASVQSWGGGQEWLRKPVALAVGAFERLEHLAERGSLRPR